MTPSQAVIETGAPKPAPLLIATGTVEGVKWLALALMIFDHTNKYLYGGMLPAAFELGRLALPLFGFVLAFNLARPGVVEGEAGKRVMWRLTIVATASTPVYMALGGLSWGWWPLNIMATLVVAVIVLRLGAHASAGRRATAVIVFVLAGSIVEFWWFGLACIVAAWRFAKVPTWLNGVLLVIATASLGVVNGNQWALAALPIVALATRVTVRIPRLSQFFYWAYPSHLLALHLLAR